MRYNVKLVRDASLSATLCVQANSEWEAIEKAKKADYPRYAGWTVEYVKRLD